MLKKLKILLKNWAGEYLPENYLFFEKAKRPKSLHELLKAYTARFLIHPLKRRIARYYLIFLKKIFGIKVIALTGSAGKTSSKDMISSILSLKGNTISTHKNIDPIFNIPTTILKCKPSTKFLVLEMSVEFPNEMDFYLWLAKPDLVMITNIYPTHTVYLNDINGVFREKSKIVKFLKKDSFVVLNKENEYLRGFGESLKNKVLWFGCGSQITAKNINYNLSGKTKFLLVNKKQKLPITLPVIGEQFVKNALAASAVCLALGMPLEIIKKGIESTVFPKHRMRIFQLKTGTYILDDSYNNNPQAAEEAIRTYIKLAGKLNKLIVFGDMLELGKFEKTYHKKLGEILGRLKIDYLIGVGKASKILSMEAEKKLGKDRVFSVENWQDALEIIENLVSDKQVILIKGSRSIGLDNLVDRLLDKYNQSIISK